jgi:hypothetical protein
MSMLVRHVSEPIPAPATIDPTIDPQLADWIVWLLKKDPKDRPEDAQVAWDKLEEIVIHLVGPRWRREARLQEEAAPDESAKPLTPAPFSEERERVTTPEPYMTSRGTPPRSRPDGAPAVAAAPPEPLPPPAPRRSRRRRPLLRPPPRSQSRLPRRSLQRGSLDLGSDEDMYLAFAPGAQKVPPAASPPAAAARGGAARGAC